MEHKVRRFDRRANIAPNLIRAAETHSTPYHTSLAYGLVFGALRSELLVARTGFQTSVHNDHLQWEVSFGRFLPGPGSVSRDAGHLGRGASPGPDVRNRPTVAVKSTPALVHSLLPLLRVASVGPWMFGVELIEPSLGDTLLCVLFPLVCPVIPA